MNTLQIITCIVICAGSSVNQWICPFL